MNKNIKCLIVLALSIVMLIMLAAIAMVSLKSKEQPAEEKKTYAPNAVVGALPGKTDEQIKADMQGKIAEGMIAFSINTNIALVDGKSEALLKLESPITNTNNVKFVITRDDNGDQLYRTGLMAPNSYIDKDFLQTKDPLKKGSYNCTATITLHDEQTSNEIGKVQAAVAS